MFKFTKFLHNVDALIKTLILESKLLFGALFIHFIGNEKTNSRFKPWNKQKLKLLLHGN